MLEKVVRMYCKKCGKIYNVRLDGYSLKRKCPTCGETLEVITILEEYTSY